MRALLASCARPCAAITTALPAARTPINVATKLPFVGKLPAAWQAAPIHSFVDKLPLHTGRPRLLVIGTGWGGARLLRDINPKLYDLSVLSARNHMVFTPLLASTCVGTLEPQCVAVHITDIQPRLFLPQNRVFIVEALSVDPKAKVVEARSDGVRFGVPYDKLVIATGSQGSTFGIPGVLEHTHFLRDLHQAEAIRNRLVNNIALAGIPERSAEERQRLLDIVIVGGGPTGVEVAGELTDFIKEDLVRMYPHIAKDMRITIIEAKEILGTFSTSLREYAARKMVERGVKLRKGSVKCVTSTSITLQDGEVFPFGLCIWSTGVGPTPFISGLPFAKTSAGRLAIDSCLRVLAPPEQLPAGAPGADKVCLSTEEQGAAEARDLQPVPDVYALGDCCANPANPLPALAQVAEQQGRFLAEALNDQMRTPEERRRRHAGKQQTPQDFVYKSLGSMANLGGFAGLLELTGRRGNIGVAGLASWISWRSAYLTRLGSLRKRIVVVLNWTMTLVFGRDMSRW